MTLPGVICNKIGFFNFIKLNLTTVAFNFFFKKVFLKGGSIFFFNEWEKIDKG